MQRASSPVVKELVLIGGGHAHIAVLKRLGMRPLDGLRITLITRDIDTPYSGMLPGYIAGHYQFDECHIDLGPLARFAGARLYHAEVEKLDPDNRLVHVKGRPPVSYDLLSINSGSRPSVNDVPGAEEFALVAKPIDVFLQRWQELQKRIILSKGPIQIAVIGGGAGGVELVLSAQHHLQNLLKNNNDDAARLHFKLLTQGPNILLSHNKGVQRRFTQVLSERGIEVLTNYTAVRIDEEKIHIEGQPSVAADAVIFVTTASAPTWPLEAGLATDQDGFIKVDRFLQSVSHPGVFAAGDIAALPDTRPKSGVFAVRQGPVLANNLKRSAVGQSLRPYHAQKNFLGLISTGNQYAVASRGGWSGQGKWLWKVKDWIDRRFMQKYNNLPEMRSEEIPAFTPGMADEVAIRELSTVAMRCGGCGAKVGSTILTRVMDRLPEKHREDVLIGRNSPDDSAMLAVPEGKVMVQSVDYFRAFLDDAYTFGAIAANHALGDLYAMGAEPQSVLAIATIPYGREKIVEEALYEVLAGTLHVLEPTGAVLAGGHSSEGVELAFGLTVNGLVEPDQVWRKNGLRSGDILILTKAIGTGTLFAADMRRKAKGRWIDGAIESMLLSNQLAAECLRNYDVGACTDVTGFGLIGHLIEMTRASQVDAEIFLDSVPVLPGADKTVASGIFSSLQPQNLRLRRAIQNFEEASQHSLFPLLFDPQTAGGLLACIPEKHAHECIHKLRTLGYRDATTIGRIKPEGEFDAPVKISC